MAIPASIEKAFLKSADYIYARCPQSLPGKEQLLNCKIVAHRGGYDNRSVFENTLPAFDRIKGAGLWGTELDVRWTKDKIPVVFHDRVLLRLFGSQLEISQQTRAELKRSFPLIPSLATIVERYGKSLHLMVELKDGFFPDPAYQFDVLKHIFTPLTPCRDYHLLSLNPSLFDLIDFVPPEAFLPIAEINVSDISKKALRCNYGGISGHYLLIPRRLIKKHRQKHQRIGTGFVNSGKCMCRELNRKVEWIFSQQPLLLKTIRDDLLTRFS